MKARLVFPATVLTARMPGAYDPYARCSRSVCSVLTACMPGTWETFAQRSEINNGLHPVSPVNKAVKQKGEADGRGRKYTEETFL
ncbi:hypothetical protein ACJEEU_01695 [Bacteroides salyersiae]|uniref:hypothetical protein n=1 Tax=Bacteroides salyersiae TaxID=291644 RepID=UPI00397C298C